MEYPGGNPLLLSRLFGFFHRMVAKVKGPDITEYSTLEERFETILRGYGDLITRICFHYTSDGNLDDLRQDCLINIWRGLGEFRKDAQISTWLYRICINTCISSYRSGRRHRDGRSPVELLRETPDSYFEEMEEAESMAERREALYRLIEELPLVERGIIMMWLDERSYDEIAEVSGLSRNNVAVKIHRIKERLLKAN